MVQKAVYKRQMKKACDPGGIPVVIVDVGGVGRELPLVVLFSSTFARRSQNELTLGANEIGDIELCWRKRRLV